MPSTELRRFGLVTAGAVLVFFGLVPAVLGRPLQRWPFVLAAVLIVFALTVPRALGPAHRVLMAVGRGLGWVNTRILLTVVFFVVLTPIALVRRALGKRPLRLARTNDASYRVASVALPKERMKEPF